MIQAMLAVMEKVGMLFVMMAVGYLCARFRIVTSRGATQMTNVLLYVVSPCLVVSSFLNSKGITMGSVLLTALISGLGMGGTILLTYLVFRREKDRSRRNLLRFASAYSNCGFMGVPLAQAVLGGVGVVYASACTLGFNLLVWTHGYTIINSSGVNQETPSARRKSILKKMFLNPGTIAFLIGIPLLAFSVQLPAVITEPMTTIGSMNTPLAMLVVGTYIAKVEPREFLSDLSVYKVCLFRLVLFPAVYLGAMCLLRPEPNIFICSTILLSAPAAANTVLFSAMFGNDTRLACKILAISTLCSILTMPVFITLAQRFTGVL